MASIQRPCNNKLTNRRLWLGFFHYWRANRLTFFHQLELAMFREPSSGRN